MINIPPRIFYPGLIVGLLSLSIAMSVGGLYFAMSDGGPEIVPDHYEKSVEYDDFYEARRASIELGWDVEIELDGDRGDLRVVDDDGAPVSDLEGSLTFHRPEKAEPVASVPVAEAPDEPGFYRFDDETDRPGTWDLDVELQRGDDVYVDSLRTTTDS